MKFNVRMTSDVLIYFCWLFFLKGYRKSLLSVIRQVGHCLRILFHPHPWLGLIFFREFKNYTLCLLVLGFFLFCFSCYIKLFFESVMHAYNEIRLYYLSPPPTYLSSSLGTLQFIFVPISCPLLVFFFPSMNGRVHLVPSYIYECRANHGVLETSLWPHPLRMCLPPPATNACNSSVRGGLYELLPHTYYNSDWLNLLQVSAAAVNLSVMGTPCSERSISQLFPILWPYVLPLPQISVKVIAPYPFSLETRYW